MQILSAVVPWRFRSWHNFVKANANFFFREVLRTPPMACALHASVEAHILVCQRDLHMALLAIKSFLRYVPEVALVIHEDGSLTKVGGETLRRHLPGARLVSRAEADREIEQLLPPEQAAERRAHVLLMKVYDFNHFNRDGRPVLILDSDLVFRAAPDEAVEWIRGNDERVFYNPDPMRDTYRALVRPAAPLPDWFNSGFVGYRHRITLDEIVDATRTMRYALEDQTVYAYLFAGRPSVALDPLRYHVYQGGELPREARMLHFISPDRFTDMTYVRVGQDVCAGLASGSALLDRDASAHVDATQ